jgi:hypothetical protein
LSGRSSVRRWRVPGAAPTVEHGGPVCATCSAAARDNSERCGLFHGTC